MLIDALLTFHDDMMHLTGGHACLWQRRLALVTEQNLRGLTNGLPSPRWLVHARHRTQTRPVHTLDRRLYEAWIPQLVAAVSDLISQTAAAAAQSTHTWNDTATTARLLRARHGLQHACLRLNLPNQPNTAMLRPRRKVRQARKV
ncbi:hypothetical protein ACFQ71_40025 [Streptomyces sp. NPDC056534]|uniref:hypothetical protein n=1 Tax=Streptomyces sp. NPDC056534 TaxID=3345857 RepID=UPI0036A504DB